MKNPAAPLFLILLIAGACSQSQTTGSDKQTLRILDSLLSQREFFLLDDFLAQSGSKVNGKERSIYQAFLKNAFNDVSGSNEMIEQILSDDENILSDSMTARLLVTQRDNFVKLYNYKRAYEQGEEIIQKYRASVDTALIKHIVNLNILYRAIADTPPQSVTIDRDFIIEWHRDKVGLITIPVRAASETYQFIFDTRASVSTITMTYAKNLGLRIIDSPYEESSGITGNKFKTYPAVADSIMIGDLMVRNVIFQVVPDEILKFPSADYHIDGIIGFPVIKQWKEVRINKNNSMTIPSKPLKNSAHNLAFDESTTVINLKTDVGMVSFHFDTGANSTMLYYNYLKRFGKDVISKATKQTTEVGGVGGSKRSMNYVYPLFPVYVSDSKVELQDVQVLNAPVYHGQKYYGNIGQDLLSHFDETIVNFEDMYFELK
jgi:predicted aspartyl protease